VYTMSVDVPFVDVCVYCRNGISYYPRTLSNSVCLVEGVCNGITYCWEVWKLLPYGKNKSGFSNRWGVVFPRPRDFGTYGWSFSSRSSAEEKLLSLTDLTDSVDLSSTRMVSLI